MVICATANQVNCHDIGSSIFTLSAQPQFQNHFRCQGAEFHESSPNFARNPSATGAVATCHPSLQLGISVQHHLPRKHLRHHGAPQWYKRRIKEPFRTTFLNQRCVACENSKESSWIFITNQCCGSWKRMWNEGLYIFLLREGHKRISSGECTYLVAAVFPTSKNWTFTIFTFHHKPGSFQIIRCSKAKRLEIWKRSEVDGKDAIVPHGTFAQKRRLKWTRFGKKPIESKKWTNPDKWQLSTNKDKLLRLDGNCRARRCNPWVPKWDRVIRSCNCVKPGRIVDARYSMAAFPKWQRKKSKFSTWKHQDCAGSHCSSRLYGIFLISQKLEMLLFDQCLCMCFMCAFASLQQQPPLVSWYPLRRFFPPRHMQILWDVLGHCFTSSTTFRQIQS